MSNFDEIISLIPNNNLCSGNMIDQISRHNKCNRSFNDNQINSRRAHLALCNNNDYSLSIQGNFGSYNFLSADSPTSVSPFLHVSNSGSSIRRRYRTGHSNISTATSAKAWNLLATYVVGQIRFGYELERSLQQQSKQLIKNIFFAKNDNDNEIIKDKVKQSFSYINENTTDVKTEASEFDASISNIIKQSSIKSNHIQKKTKN